MGFLDFLKKNRPVPPAPVAEEPPIPPRDDFGSAMVSDEPPKPDAFLSDLEEHHDAADDLFSPHPSSTPASATTPSPIPAHEDHAWMPIPPRQPSAPTIAPVPTVAPIMPAPIASSAAPSSDLPDFSEEDIAALENLEHTVEAAAQPAQPPTIIGMDVPEIARESTIAMPILDPSLELPAPTPLTTATPTPIRQPTAQELPSLPDAPTTDMGASPFISADDYLGVTEAIRSVRRAVRKGDDALRDALARHEDLGTQYARAASDIAMVEDRLRDLDNALFER